MVLTVDIEILRVSHWIWGKEIESGQDQDSEGLSDEDDVDGADHVDVKDSMPKYSPSKRNEDGSSGIDEPGTGLEESREGDWGGTSSRVVIGTLKVRVMVLTVAIEILRVSHWIWGKEIESDQDQDSEGLSDEDDVDGADH
nr:hypothetical protein [Tanacetum cinerariifolium]